MSAESLSMALSAREFSLAYSRHCDSFLARRSVLDSTLFPEKPAQMCFGYEAIGRAFGPFTAWLDDRMSAAELGEALRTIRPLAPGIVPTSALWMNHAALTSWALQDIAWPDDVEDVLGYWRGVYEAQTTTFDPPGGFLSGQASFQHRLLGEVELAPIAKQMDPDAADHAAPMLAAATNYSWLMEAESRQGTYSHGLYGIAGGTLLIREFINLGGSHYPWAPRDEAIPATPVSVALRLTGATGDFDVYGVPRLEPPDYARRATGVAVLTEDGWIAEPAEWLRETTRRLQRAHVELYRTIARWSPRQRFTAGASSYFAMYSPIIRMAGGSDEDVRRLLLEPLADAEPIMERYLARPHRPELWEWAATRGDATLFAPVIEALG